jgi:hypothetical protein
MNFFFRLLVTCCACLSLCSKAQVVLDGHRKKDIPFFIEYNQMQEGFFSLEGDCRFMYGDIFPSFHNFGLAAGYNPWHNDLIVEQKTYFNFVFFSTGVSLSYIDQLSNNEESCFGIKPQIGLDFYALRMYYGYQFIIGNRPEYLNYHNISLSFLNGIRGGIFCKMQNNPCVINGRAKKLYVLHKKEKEPPSNEAQKNYHDHLLVNVFR